MQMVQIPRFNKFGKMSKFPAKMTHMRPPQNPFRVFYGITGVSLMALLTGFSVCLFDIDNIGACVDHAESAVEILKAFGDHVLAWFLALLEEVFDRYPIS